VKPACPRRAHGVPTAYPRLPVPRRTHGAPRQRRYKVEGGLKEGSTKALALQPLGTWRVLESLHKPRAKAVNEKKSCTLRKALVRLLKQSVR